MIDISSATLDRIIAHRVGNKIREDGYILSHDEAKGTSILNNLLLKHYLSPLSKELLMYEFFHETDISLNPIRQFTNKIFLNNTNFTEQSKNIAKHLYSVSSHPNISSGELILILFSGIIKNKKSTQGLAIIKIESKDDYLHIEENAGTLQVLQKSGISVSKIQKGALILPENEAVFSIDNLGQKTKYWIESFLKIVPQKSSMAFSNAGGALIKSISSKIIETKNSIDFKNKLEHELLSSETLSINTIQNIAEEFLDTPTITGIISGIQDNTGLKLTNDISFSPEQLEKQLKSIKSKTKINPEITLLITNPNIEIKEIKIEDLNNGYRATIDIKNKEKHNG